MAKDPSSIGFPRDEWIHGHDAEQHAESVVKDEIKKFSTKTSSPGDQSENQDSNGLMESITERMKTMDGSLEAVKVA